LSTLQWDEKCLQTVGKGPGISPRYNSGSFVDIIGPELIRAMFEASTD